MKKTAAASVALLLAMTLTAATGWTPACVAYTPSDPMWYVLFCWVDPPPPPPPYVG
jgi:hypothetical protein